MDHNMIRAMFSQGDTARDEGLNTPEDIVRYDDISYGPHGKWNLLDVYRPKNAGDAILPVIVSVHGGGWVYGDKDRYQFYCMNLAQRGFVVLNFSYRLAPEDPFPAAIEDVNGVFCWLANHAGEYGMDLDRLYTVGDSAGGQLSSQYIAMLTNPDFAALYGFQIPSGKIRVCAAAFNCGQFQTDPNSDLNMMEKASLAAYLGPDWRNQLPRIDTLRYITSAYPPSFVMTASHDFLRGQAPLMCKRLQEVGVRCEYHLYGTEEQDYMAHVFHLNIRLPEAEICNQEECDFFLANSPQA